MEPAPIPKRLPSLDGWRAVSVCLVLVGHAQLASPRPHLDLPLISDGNLGVRFFFVISGFLITWLMLQEARHAGAVNLRHFYLRRALRIFPVYFAFAGVLLILQFTTAFKETTAGWLGIVTFTQDFNQGRSGLDGSMAGAHLWSLAVEEQFYLLWPGMFVLAANRSIGFKAVLLAVPIIAATIFRTGNFIFFVGHAHPMSIAQTLSRLPDWSLRLCNNFSFFCYQDSLAFGCLAALLLFSYRPIIANLFNKWTSPVFNFGFTLVLVPEILEWMTDWRFINIFGDSLQALGFSLVVVQSVVQPELGPYRCLNWAPIRWFGVLSYSIYIWQQIFYFRAWNGNAAWLIHPNAWWAWFCIIPVLMTAVVSYYGLERPLFRLRSRFRHAGGEITEAKGT